MATTRKASSGSKRSRTPKGEGGKGVRSTRARVVAEPMDEELVVEPVAALPLEPTLEAETMPVTVMPEPAFASRVMQPVPAPPPPPNRRAVFFDVENTSRPEHVESVLAHLQLDRHSVTLDLIAVGNWRVIGHDTARILAKRGAQCVHSAPSVGVRDWSDLRIAVAAGVWLAGARPGDVIDIISDDQAFDAVGDVAASLGVAFRRMSYRLMAGISREAPVVEEPAGGPRGRRSRRGGRRRRGGPGRSAHGPMPAPSPVPAPVYAANGDSGTIGEGHTAPHDEIIDVVRHLMATLPPGRDVNIDNLSNALKARGFSRPPGSPRLITRLRRIKEIDVSRAGVITLRGDASASEAAEPAAYEASASSEEAGPGDETEPSTGPEGEGQAPRRRRRRRGGRRRRGRGSGASAAATS